MTALLLLLTAVAFFTLGRASKRLPNTVAEPALPLKEQVQEGMSYWMPPLPVPIRVLRVEESLFHYSRVDGKGSKEFSFNSKHLEPVDLPEWEAQRAAEVEVAALHPPALLHPHRPALLLKHKLLNGPKKPPPPGYLPPALTPAHHSRMNRPRTRPGKM